MFALGFMFLGMLAGYLLRHTKIPALICRLVMPLILALLFCMGVLIGDNPAIMDNLHGLGLQGAVLAAATLAASLITVLLICRFVTGDRVAAAPADRPADAQDEKRGDAS